MDASILVTTFHLVQECQMETIQPKLAEGAMLVRHNHRQALISRLHLKSTWKVSEAKTGRRQMVNLREGL
jgi:hypothetical protein